MYALIKACLLFYILKRAALSECTRESLFRKRIGKYLANYFFRTERARSEAECGIYCLRYLSCRSVSYKIAEPDKGLCELSDKTITATSKEEKHNLEYIYLEKVWLEHEKVHSAEAKQNTYPPSCREMFLQNTSLPDGVYTLQQNLSSLPYKVYCHMTDIPGCGGDGWTLVLKVDGNTDTFTYDSPLWTNNETYAIQDGMKGLTEKESKLASYSNTPFTKICLGMSYNGDRKWMTFDYTASSLYSVIEDGKFKATTAGRNAWKSLIDGSILQPNCNKEGFNVPFNSHGKMRIGILTNNEHDCNTCDTWIGWSSSDGYTCSGRGNNNQWKIVKTFGYILVK